MAWLKMESLPWPRNSGQPWGGAESLWGWAVSRLHLDWTKRFSQEDQELLILTQSNELGRSYGEENHIGTTEKDESVYNTRKNQTSFRETSMFLAEQAHPTERERAAADQMRSNCAFKQNLALKDTRQISTSTEPPTITITSPVQDAGSSKLPGGKRKRRGSYRLARHHSINVERPAGEEVSTEGSSHTSPDELRSVRSLAEQHHGTKSSNPTITAWEAGWNVTNAIQGIFVLGLPFALARSGYVGLILLVLSAWVCNHTGRILIVCLYEEEQSGESSSVSRVRVRNSYQDIVDTCCKGLWPSCPGLGGWMVNIAQVTELLMTCTLYLVVSSGAFSDILSGIAVPRSLCYLVSLAFVLPCLLLTDLRSVSTLSLLCSLAQVLISVLVMMYCLSQASNWSWSCLSVTLDPEEFLVSVGVIIFSYTSQIFLPPLEGSMEDKGQFNAMLQWTHGAACIIKTMFALLTVLTWQAETKEVITDNLPSDLRPLVNLCLLAKALLSYPLPFYSAAEILQSYLLREAPAPLTRGGPGWSRSALLIRGTLLMTSYLLARLVPRFSLLMGLTGSVTGAAMTLILPCLCHLRLQWCLLSVRERLVDVGILVLGVTCSVSGVICSVMRLLEGL